MYLSLCCILPVVCMLSFSVFFSAPLFFIILHCLYLSSCFLCSHSSSCLLSMLPWLLCCLTQGHHSSCSSQIKSPFVEGYLKYMASLQANSLFLLNLLWRYYETNRLYLSAAKILHQLAHWER